MAQYEENQIEFAILSLVKDPILDLLSALAENVQGIVAAQSRLNVIEPDWRSFTTNEAHEERQGPLETILTGADPGLLLTYEQISSTRPDEVLATRLMNCEPTEALLIHKELITTQQGLKMTLQEEIQNRHVEDEKASGRTCDFGARMQTFARKVRSKEVP